MSEFRSPKTPEEFDRNFAQIKPAMSNTEAHLESARCLFCHDAPCIQACPTSIDIPLFIKQIHSDNLSGSARTIYESNYMGYACGQVCPTEVLCEGSCVYTEQDMPAIEIGRLQAHATRHAINQNQKLFEASKPSGHKVAVIGAGPAGISCACELRRHGIAVDVFEAKEHPSGLTLYGVAPYKILNADTLEEISYLQQQFGFTLKLNHAIQTEDDLAMLEADYDAIFIGVGLGISKQHGLQGEQLENCIGAIEFIESLKISQHNQPTGKKVIVLGGGNTAMDAASEAARLGAEQVHICYRRSKAEMGAYEFEYELAKSVGAKGLFGLSPVEIVGKQAVEGVRFAKTTTVNGKISILAGSEVLIQCDMVIKATGQEKKQQFLNQIQGMKLDERGCILIDPKTGQSHASKYFAGGDAANGGKEVVNAVAEGKTAATGILAFIGQKKESR